MSQTQDTETSLRQERDNYRRSVENAHAALDASGLIGPRDRTHQGLTAQIKSLVARAEKLRLAAEKAPASPWQPKETAPKARTRALAVYVGVYDDPCAGFISDGRFYPNGGKGSEPLTHWMPLPTLPTTQ